MRRVESHEEDRNSVITYELSDRQRVRLDADFMCVRDQFEKVCLWFLVDPTAEKEKRTIAIVGTGHPAPEDGAYLGSAMLAGGTLVWHVFEKV